MQRMNLNLSYNEMDAILSVVGSVINGHQRNDQGITKWSAQTIDLLRAAEAKIEEALAHADPDEED